jgi:hypothetical protein
MKSRSRSAIAMIFLLLLSSGIYAANCESIAGAPPSGTAPSAFSAYLVKLGNCLGTADDDDELSKRVNTLLAGKSDPSFERSRRALHALLVDVMSNPADLMPDSDRTVAVNRLQEAVDGVEKLGGAGAGSLAVTDWQWTLNGDVPAIPSLQVTGSLMAACAGSADDVGCKSARRNSLEWIRLARLTERALGDYAQPTFDQTQSYVQRRVNMWHAYRDVALPQYPWEYAVNSWRMKREDQREVGPGNKNPLGMEPIPDSQLMFLHPGASLEWRDARKETADSKAMPALYVELIGINSWDWDTTSGAMVGGKGISIIMSYANRDGGEKVGYGLMFHSRISKQFTLGITRAGDETVFLVNVDLAEYAKKQLGYWKDIQTKVDGLEARLK